MSSSGFDFESALRSKAAEVEAALSDLFREWSDVRAPSVEKLVETMSYSALGPGKRIRPALALWTAEAHGAPGFKALPWATALEMIHAYSLIHDDLPCMDDDDERRGRPTAHIAYGEARALLAGDALLTEAFGLVASAYGAQGLLGAHLIELLAQAAGVRGMVGGQAWDLDAEGTEIPFEDLQRIHRMKTGALIRAAVEGGALVAGAGDVVRVAARAFGEQIGLAFQIADDLLDAGEDGQSGRSYVDSFGLEGARAHLSQVSEEAHAALAGFPRPSEALAAVIEWNRSRRK